MKKLIIAIVAIACLPAHADKASDLYKQGLIAVKEGDVKVAETAFKEALKLQPGHANARYQLAELRKNQGSIAARARAKKLGEYVIEQVDFNKADLSDALEALTVLVEEKSKGEFSPNFMIQDPANKLGERTVTLQVKGVPAKALLDMLVQQSGAVVKYEEHAIVIKPAVQAKAE